MRKALPRYVTATLSAVVLTVAMAPVGAQAAPIRPAPRPAPPGPAAPTGRIVTGVGDVEGYHLFVAGAADGSSWHPLATIQPGGADDERWIGQQCLTGDGRTVLAAVAPWSANNSAAGMDAGADVYAVDAGSGAVRPLATGASLAYFDPGCGTAAEAVLTSYSGDDQSVTRLARIDVTTGAVVGRATVGRELTSAVPAGGRIVAADGHDLVTADGTTVRVLARFTGAVSELRPAADGGVDLLATTGNRTSVWHWSASGARHLADGATGTMHLFLGAGGHNIAVGAGRLPTDGGLRNAPAAGVRTATASLDGAVTASDLVSATGTLRNAGVTMAGAVHGRRALPGPAGVRAQAVPELSVAAATARPGGARPVTPDLTPPQSPNTTVPQCSVPRNDIFKQVWQPTSAQVRWAINQAALRALTSTYPNSARPTNNAMYTLNDASYIALPKTYPSAVFPLSANPAIAPLVMYGILAQESNWSQASWHAAPGRSGNPLISNYYGGGSSPIDYNSADCGYGIAQVTSGMQVAGWPDTTPFPPAEQVRVAVDYAENVAAGELILQQKWQQLQSLGITMNNADPAKVENWYAAIWAYNSGVHLPSEAVHWGLGWANNPDNPMYPLDRGTFLHFGNVETLGDAAHPQDWPYQEKVFGWMEVPLADGNGSLDYRGTYDWDTATGSFLATPSAATFCSPSVNNCDPTRPACRSTDDLTTCWWNQPVQWVPDNCASSCVTDSVTNAPNGHVYYSTPGLAEPAATPSSATCTLPANSAGITDSHGNLKPGVVLVDDETITLQNPTHRTPNLMGCSGTNAKLVAPASARASFELIDTHGNEVDAADTPSSPAAIDLHQLGAGVGGHLFFTHTGAPGTDEVEGEWEANLAADPTYGTAYEIKAFVPDIAAGTDHATYEIVDSSSSSSQARTINQGRYSNAWVSLGYYLCTNEFENTCFMRVRLRTTTPTDDSNQGADIAMDAIAFVPVPTGAYVALGDSYSAGEGVGGTFGADNTFDDGTDVLHSIDGNGDMCHRSPLAWPRLLAAAKGKTIIDLACAGTNTGDLAGEQYYFAQDLLPVDVLGHTINTEVRFGGDGTLHKPQRTGDCTDCSLMPNYDNAGSTYYDETADQLALLKALRPSLVTLSVGGNDIGFADVVRSCYLHRLIIGGLCRDGDFVINGTDLLDRRIQSLELVLEDTYQKVVNAVGSAANVYVVTYPSAVAMPPSNELSCSGMFNDDLAWLIPKVGELAGVIETAGQHAGVHVIDLSTLFNGHDMCGENGTPWATRPDTDLESVLFDSPSAIDNWFHPNAAGYQAIETAVAAQIP